MKEKKQKYHPAEMVVIPLESNDVICSSKSNVQKTITTPSGSGFGGDGTIGIGGEL